MINRVCISINNRCNLRCVYCHFHEKADVICPASMDINEILSHIKEYIKEKQVPVFKIGFVGNGEPLLEYDALKSYILTIAEELESGRIAAYTITNGLCLTEEMLRFFQKYKINVGFSIDGPAWLHDKYRCGTHAKVMEKIELYRRIYGKYPSMNCTVGEESLQHVEEVIRFFEPFESRITFSRMIGTYGITLPEFHAFLEKAKMRLNVRTGGYDCTMYGGLCGAGMNNFFFANGNVYLCGNCVDFPPLGRSGMPLEKLEDTRLNFDRMHCYKETLHTNEQYNRTQTD